MSSNHIGKDFGESVNENRNGLRDQPAQRIKYAQSAEKQFKFFIICYPLLLIN